MSRGYDQPLYILPFDHRGTFETKGFGWTEPLMPAQTADIAAAKGIIYDGFKAALADGVREPLEQWRARKISRQGAAAEMGRRYRAFVDIFERADA
jgi:hypothetical protein